MKKEFEKTGIIFNPDIKEAKNIAREINKKIKNSEIFSIDNFKKDVDLVIVIGGDGTFLKASRFYGGCNIPVLGFNAGRLGYLTSCRPDEIDFVADALKNRHFTIENRLMLKSENKTALNDIVIKGLNCARTATLDLYINNKKLCSYVADGLIIATPTGSTAYSLSAGGPIVSPEIDCFLVIPICPHTLNTRPIIIPSSEKILVRTLEKNQKLNISFDGQDDITVSDEIKIEKNQNYAKLLTLNGKKDKFYDILKEKLHWSVAPKK